MSVEITIPNFIKAKSPRRLRLLIIKNNSRLNMAKVHYEYKFDGKHWYAWYDEPFWQTEETKQLED